MGEAEFNVENTFLLLNAEEACEAYSVSRKTLYVWTKLHGLPCIKIDGCLRWPVEAGKLWVERKRQEATNEAAS